ncbi:hypothetical protein XHV734_1916 [Xanthomonas hortorum pv. vitians]|nr:hypothetical protein XHV734_1916 [Xanthomonas hortorum pv. vitians]
MWTARGDVRFASLHFVLMQVLPAQSIMVRPAAVHRLRCGGGSAAIYCPMRASRRIDRAVLHANGIDA